MDYHTDLRVTRTKKSIHNALIDLIEEKGFEAITVKDITSKAEINRGTFYTHYQDKYDLMTKCEEEFMRGMTDIIKNNFMNVIEALEVESPITTPLTVAVTIFDYLNQNRGFLKAVLGPKGDLSFQTKFKKFILNALIESNKIPIFNQKDFLVPAEYLVSYISWAHIGVIQQWLNSDKAETPEEMARILSTITINGPFVAAGLKK